MDNVPSSALFLIFGVLVATGVMTVAFMMTDTAKKGGITTNKTSDMTVNVIDEETIKQYIGKQYPGSQLIDVMQDLYDRGVRTEIQKTDGTWIQFNPAGTVSIGAQTASLKENIDMAVMYQGEIITLGNDKNIVAIRFAKT